MSTVDKNPVVKTRSGEVRSRLASGVVDAFDRRPRSWPGKEGET